MGRTADSILLDVFDQTKGAINVVADGAAASVDAIGESTNLDEFLRLAHDEGNHALRVNLKGSAAMVPPLVSAAAEPTLAVDGQSVLWYDTSGADALWLVTRLASGDQRKVQLT